MMRGLIFKGHLLTYNPTYNVAEWVPIHGTVSDLLPTKESLTCKLSNITLLEEMNGTTQMRWFSESRPRHAPTTTPVKWSSTMEAEIRCVSYITNGCMDIHLVKHCDEVMDSSPIITKVDSWPEVKSMEVEIPPLSEKQIPPPEEQSTGEQIGE